MTRQRAWASASLVAVAVIVVDQISKQLARSGIDASDPIDLVAGFKLSDVRNSGVAFGIDAGSDVAIVVLTAAVVAALMFLFAREPTRPRLWLATGLLVGGALSNFADRLAQGAVTDFLDPPAWPAFNLADVAIVVGAGLLALILVTPAAEGSDERAG